jgi:hypothetical protein
MRGPLSWNETVKAAALAVQSERTATPARYVADASFRWSAYDVWLSRLTPRRDHTLRHSSSEQAFPSPQVTALRD